MLSIHWICFRYWKLIPYLFAYVWIVAFDFRRESDGQMFTLN